jgi:peptidoglycan/LPS O-acetylase OafA/YrhL
VYRAYRVEMAQPGLNPTTPETKTATGRSNPASLAPLTTVRFLAAFSVVMFHFGGDLLAHLPRAAQLVFERGYVSVSFFFVLSGFILAYTYFADGRTLAPRAFYRARFARIYPVYLLGFVLQGFAFGGNMPASIGTLAMTAGLNLLLLQSWVVTLIPEWNVPAWSLSTEAFFYLIFPLAGLFILKLRQWQALVLCLVLTTLAFAPCVIDLTPLQGRPTAHQLDLIGCSPLLRSLEFLIGVLVGRMYLRMKSVEWGNILALLATAAILATFYGSSSQPLELWREKALIPLFALSILGLANCKGRLWQWLSLPWLVVLGEASYALYILHWPLYNIAMSVRSSLLRLPSNDPHPGSRFFLIYLVSAIGISVFVLKKIELPARAYLRRGTRQHFDMSDKELERNRTHISA